MKKILILGSQGMLGQALLQEFGTSGEYAVTGWDREEIDLTDFSHLAEELAAFRPDIVINAAAYNAVDPCETDDSEYEKAKLLNAELPERLAQLSREHRFLLVHYSTDYVFDGVERGGYAEEARPQPLSRYGETKLGGEGGVLHTAENFYIIRLSKLFGKPGSSPLAKQSFFSVMLEKGKTESVLKAVDGERSNFTYAPDLARATRELIEAKVPSGMYHLTNTGGVTWYEAAQKLFELAGLSVVVEPVLSDAFPRPAKRPAASVLKNTKRPALRPYEEALREFVETMVQ